MGRKTDLKVDYSPFDDSDYKWEETIWPNSPMPYPQPGIDLDDGKSVFSAEMCREAIRKALPSPYNEEYIEEVEAKCGEEYWNQFDTPQLAVHDALIYWDALQPW